MKKLLLCLLIAAPLCAMNNDADADFDDKVSDTKAVNDKKIDFDKDSFFDLPISLQKIVINYQSDGVYIEFINKLAEIGEELVEADAQNHLLRARCKQRGILIKKKRFVYDASTDVAVESPLWEPLIEKFGEKFTQMLKTIKERSVRLAYLQNLNMGMKELLESAQ